MFQRFMIEGGLAAEPELRYSPTGEPYARLLVAVDREARGAPLQKETAWYRVIVWGGEAQACKRRLSKGSQVMVEGDRVRPVAFLTQDNQPAAALEITARTVTFLDAPRYAETQARRNVQLEMPL